MITSKRVLLIKLLLLCLAAAVVGGYSMAWFTDERETGPVDLQAGTVLIEADSSAIASQYFDSTEHVFVYGIEVSTGDIYEIDPVAQIENRIFQNPDTYSPHWYPNALAFDSVNDRLYFAGSDDTLFFYDMSADELVNADPEGEFSHDTTVCGATFGGGYYWYIPDNEEGDDEARIHRVSFDADGMIDSITREVMTTDYDIRMGDIAIDYDDGIIYGSSSGYVGTDKLYFTYDTETEEFSRVDGADAKNLQLAWGSDGVLYGHKIGNQNWYSVAHETGHKDHLFTGVREYNDLASGYISKWNPGDCAWARFEVENSGSKDSFVRVELSGFWQQKTDEDWTDWDPDEAGAEHTDVVDVKPAADMDEWKYHDGYYYYEPELEPGETAELSLRVCLDGPETCNLYQGKRFVLEGTFEAIQTTHDAPGEAGWYVP